jgi:deoxyribodipyrimidine photo-lyase
MREKIAVCWFRRDLRLQDQVALYHALEKGIPVLPLFIFDRDILDDLQDKTDRRVEFIHGALQQMQAQLVKMGSSLRVEYGFPQEVFAQLAAQYDIDTVYTNHDYEPYAIKRDTAIQELLAARGIGFLSFKDQVICEKAEVVKDDGKPYTVYTPYSKRWKALVNESFLRAYPVENHTQHFYKQSPQEIPALESMGFHAAGLAFPPAAVPDEVLRRYHEQRDLPAIAGTSRLSVHLRFGTISIRALARQAMATNEKFLNELIWRDFYHTILWHFPHVVHSAFKPAYDAIPWRDSEPDFARWCAGQTGYPLVDAGMRELNATGFMHNRVRMVVASFLTKHLLIDWRKGESYFAQKLLDFDLAANNGGWQWAAGCGCDAAPYFRVFNPTLQTEKFDKDLHYIRKWIPELDELTYPQPMIEHAVARNRCLEVYKRALG